MVLGTETQVGAVKILLTAGIPIALYFAIFYTLVNISVWAGRLNGAIRRINIEYTHDFRKVALWWAILLALVLFRYGVGW